jgi:hypothetical protein
MKLCFATEVKEVTSEGYGNRLDNFTCKPVVLSVILSENNSAYSVV